MAVDFEEFKKLVPQDRVRELQKLLDQLVADIKDKEGEIREAQHLLSLAKDESAVLEQVSVPEATKGPELEEITKEKEEERTPLEDILVKAAPKEAAHEVAHRPIQELYSELRSIYDRQSQTGIETAADRNVIYAIGRGLEEKKRDIEAGQYRPAEKAAHLMTAAEEMAENMYKGTTKSMYKN